MNDFLAALGLMLAFEGLILAGFPAAWRRAVQAMLDAPETTLRITGLVVGAIGVFIVYLVRA